MRAAGFTARTRRLHGAHVDDRDQYPQLVAATEIDLLSPLLSRKRAR